MSTTTFLERATMLFCCVMLITSCKKDEDDAPGPNMPPVNEEELLTTVRITFNTLSDAEYKYFVFTDLDGDGGNAPVITADTLSEDSIYSMNIEVLNESVSPIEEITQEIIAEGVDHQFFYQVTGANLLLAYGDADTNAMPIGQSGTCIAGGPSIGTLKITLRHMSGTGVSFGDITNAGGDTDIEVTFPAVVQ